MISAVTVATSLCQRFAEKKSRFAHIHQRKIPHGPKTRGGSYPSDVPFIHTRHGPPHPTTVMGTQSISGYPETSTVTGMRVTASRLSPAVRVSSQEALPDV